jgi:pimeloyl-ACP methyl ester carboxylesterase
MTCVTPPVASNVDRPLIGDSMRRLLLPLLLPVCLALSSLAAAQSTDKTFNSKGVPIRYIEQGTGEPVLLIHGYTRSIETNWIETGVFQDLAKDHRVIAFDLRGHGKSGKPTDPVAYGDDLVQDAIRLLDHLGIRRAHVVGYSLGAIITAKLVTTNPERFLTATLGGHAGYRNWKPEYDRNAEARALELEGDVPFRGLVVSMTPSDEPKRSEEQIRALSAALAAVNDLKALAAYQRAGSRALNSTDSAMAAVRVPMLGVIGSLDNVPSMNALKGVLPSLTLVVIDGATHVGDRGAARRPEFVKAIRDFIDANRGK